MRGEPRSAAAERLFVNSNFIHIVTVIFILQCTYYVSSYLNRNFKLNACCNALWLIQWAVKRRVCESVAVVRTTHNLKNPWATSSLWVKFRYICYRMYVMWPSASEQTARLIKTLPLLAPSALPHLSFYNFTFTVENTIQDSLLWKLYQYALQARPKVFSFLFSSPFKQHVFFIIKKNPCSCCWPALSCRERALEKIKENGFHQRYYLQPLSKPGYTPDRKCTWVTFISWFYSSIKCKISS